MSALGSPVSFVESFREFRSNGLMVEGPTFRLENIYDYEPDGHHPVHIGDALGGRYKVMDKLGSGGYGNVWLCSDTGTNTPKYVAVKILMAVASIPDCPELRVKKLTELGIDKGDTAERFGAVLDQFTIKGPNGTHFALVYPVLGPTVRRLFGVLKAPEAGRVLRRVCFQAAEAMATLHSYGVCHGDFRPSNILAGISGLDGLSEEQLIQALGEPLTTRVLLATGPGEGVPHSKSTAPQYLVEPVRWFSEDGLEKASAGLITASACVVDFGESFMVTNLPEDLGIPQDYCPPEYVLDKEIGFGTDLWALGCTLFEIRTGQALFNIFDDDPDEYLAVVVERLGRLPEPWWSTTWEKRRLYFEDEAGPDGRVICVQPAELEPRRAGSGERIGDVAYLQPRSRSMEESITAALAIGEESVLGHDMRAISKAEVELLADLLRKLFRYSPDDRITAEDALDHPWFNM